MEKPEFRDGKKLPARLAKDLAGQSWVEIEMGDTVDRDACALERHLISP